MKHLSAIQSQLAINKSYINYLEDQVVRARMSKSFYDSEGMLDMEYYHHNYLKALRTELKGYVKIQQALKQMAKGK